jgi:hypothetical protein
VAHVQLGPIQAASKVQGPDPVGATKYEYLTSEVDAQVDVAATVTELPRLADPTGAVTAETAEHAAGAEKGRATMVCDWGTV